MCGWSVTIANGSSGLQKNNAFGDGSAKSEYLHARALPNPIFFFLQFYGTMHLLFFYNLFVILVFVLKQGFVGQLKYMA